MACYPRRVNPCGAQREKGHLSLQPELTALITCGPGSFRGSRAEKALSANQDVLLLLKHPPTYTLGLSGSETNMLASRESLVRQATAVVNVDRGDDVTFHGPGQLVGIPSLTWRS